MPQDPASIQRQIEETRAELATTIDAIARQASPRRIAERAGEQARAKVAELRTRAGLPGGVRPELTTDAAAAAPGPATSAGGPDAVRWGRLALAVGATMLLVVHTTRRRRRQRG